MFGARRVAELTELGSRRLGRRHRLGPAAAQDARRATAWRSSCSTTWPAASRSWCSRRRSASTASLIESDAMLLVRGKFEKDDESARIVATELLPIAALKERTTREVVDPPARRRTARHDVRGARGAAVAAPRRPPRVARARRAAARRPLRVRAEVAQRVQPSERLVAEVEQICGAGTVELR